VSHRPRGRDHIRSYAKSGKLMRKVLELVMLVLRTELRERETNPVL
jgi:hypothetical protein